MVFKSISFPRIGQEKQLKLYSSIDQIRAVLFFSIMKTGDKSTLNLTPGVKATDEQLNEAWSELLEQYSIASNSLNYKVILNERKTIEILKNKITTLHCCYLLLKLGANNRNQEIVDTLKYFGVPGEITADELSKRINRDNSYYKLLVGNNNLNESNTGKKEEVNFFRSVAKYESATGESVNANEIILAHWIEKVKLLKSQKPKPNGRRK